MSLCHFPECYLMHCSICSKTDSRRGVPAFLDSEEYHEDVGRSISVISPSLRVCLVFYFELLHILLYIAREELRLYAL